MVSTAFFGEKSFDGGALTSYLADRSVRHRLTKTDEYREKPKGEATTFTLDRYSSEVFQGILPDTGAANFSTAGQHQVTALQRTHRDVTIDTSQVGQAKIRFGSGDPVLSIGTVTVPTPFGPIDFHAVPADTPFLLCLHDMDRLPIQFDNLANVMRQGKLSVPVIRKWGHPWMLLGPPEHPIANCPLTDPELRRLHRRFGHPSVQRLHKVLHEAGHKVEMSAIEHLTMVCHQCQMNGSAPQRFRFTIHDDCAFNHEIFVDVVYLDGNVPVLHIVDLATAFHAGRFLPDMTAKSAWEARRAAWIDTYQGPPDWIVADAGRNFVASEFRQEAEAMACGLKIIPVEAHHSIGKVERYHAMLRRAYNVIRRDCPEMTKESILQSALKAINDTAGPDGVVPTLLVFGAYPRLTHDSPPSPDIVQRAAAVRKASEAIKKLHATRKVNDALAARTGPDTSALKVAEIGSLVRVWREKGGWSGPCRLLAVDGENCTVDANGARVFRSTVVKPYHLDPDDAITVPDDRGDATTTEAPVGNRADTMQDAIIVANPAPSLPASSSPRRLRGRPRKTPSNGAALIQETDVVVIFMSTKEEADRALAVELRSKGIITAPGAPFEESTKKEVKALIDRGVFVFITFDPERHKGVRIFKSRIVNEVKDKTADTPYEKSRLVIQGYADDGKTFILTQSPTIQRASQRLILALAPSLLLREGFRLWLRDITQAYTQSQSKLNRTILARLPSHIRNEYPAGTIMEVVKPLYGIAEAGTHWWATYNRHHKENLEMASSTYDPCLLLPSEDNADFGMVGMQTDDTIGLSDSSFDAREGDELAQASFSAKPKTYLSVDDKLLFNGGIVAMASSESTVITQRQKGQGTKLQLIDAKSPTAKQDYVQQRARGAYIASICQPEACFDLSTAAQQQDPTDEDIKNLNRRIEWQMKSLDRGLTFVPLDLSSAKLFVFVDGSFANNRDMTSQLGFIIILGNEEPINGHDDAFTLTGNVVHYSSTKSKRVTRSVLASEIYGMVAGVDMAYAISSTLTMITKKLNLPPIPTIAWTDSYSLYECLVKLGTPQEKRLMIDIMALRQSYERRELYEVRWIHGDDNLADAFTKATPNQALENFITTSSAQIRMEGWVARA
ncbi:hypothetical protein QIS74_02513 [Colletotrichum tabaci]|uniref:Integrase catalytic domain-containing protein n=1 Tax=Colletotrichum tabaci TaxID=1209068 RepID=A0AAV9TPY5_9PEZI